MLFARAAAVAGWHPLFASVSEMMRMNPCRARQPGHCAACRRQPNKIQIKYKYKIYL